MSSSKALLFATTLLAGCGFQLRGAISVPPEMARTYIETADRHSEFYRELRSTLRASGVEVVDRPADDAATLSVLADETGQRVLSVSARNVPREFEVFYTVRYQVLAGTRTLLPPRTQTLTRDYTWTETEVLGKEKEEALLREDIARNLVRVIMMQVSGI